MPIVKVEVFRKAKVFEVVYLCNWERESRALSILGYAFRLGFSTRQKVPTVCRKTRVGERLVRSFSHQTRDRKELATKQFVLPKLKISESTKVFLGSF